MDAMVHVSRPEKCFELRLVAFFFFFNITHVFNQPLHHKCFVCFLVVYSHILELFGRS